MRLAPRLSSLLLCAHALFAPMVRAEPPATPAASSNEYGAVATASRLARPLSPSATTVVILTHEELERSPSLTTDSALRTVPSALTFRRSTSLSADPSSQGLNLRGVAPSGVSRTLVLLDGVPINDPFAGSVYYRALPRLGLSRIEVVPGGGSALYGSSALSGVVQLLSRPAGPGSFDADASYGMANTLAAGARAAGSAGESAGSLEADWLSSDGYQVVSSADRGAIDGPAASLHGTAIARGSLAVSRRLTLRSGLSFFREQLSGSTRYTSASAELATGSLQAEYDARARGRWQLLSFARLARFDQSRARVDEERSSEQLAARQHVPAHDQGLTLTWRSATPTTTVDRSGVALGVDTRWVDGFSREQLYPAQPMPTSTVLREAGGKQLLAGAFAESSLLISAILRADAALRVDWVRNTLGRQESERLAAPRSAVAFADQHALAVSPRLALLLTPTDWLRVRGSAYRSFRTPTLNELYRPFQVGTVLTAANPRLSPEFLTGAELGLETISHDALTLRTTGFWNLIQDPIINATLPEPLPDGSTRARVNLPQARVAGMELSAELRVVKRLSVLLAYTFVAAHVTKQGALTGLTGKRLPQDPAHRFSALLSFDDPRYLTASVQLRALGLQYEDDLNTLPMPGYAVLDLLLARRLTRQLELFVAAENLLNETYLVGRAGVDTIGTPLLARVGFRLRLPASSPSL